MGQPKTVCGICRVAFGGICASLYSGASAGLKRYADGFCGITDTGGVLGVAGIFALLLNSVPFFPAVLLLLLQPLCADRIIVLEDGSIVEQVKWYQA